MMLNKIGVGIAPQIHLSRTTANRMWLVSCCALAPILQSAASDGFYSLLIAAVAVAAAVATDLILDVGTGRSVVGDGSSIASALLLTLLLPNRINLAIPIIGSIFAIAVVKRSFGGLGANWLNPALGSWLFLRASWPTFFSSALVDSPLSLLESAVSKGLSDPSGSPLAVLKIVGYKPGSTDSLFVDHLNNSIFSFLGAELPAGYLGFFCQTSPGIIADRGFLSLLLATVILVASRSARSFVPAFFLFIFAILIRFEGSFLYGGTFASGDMLFGLFTGGTILAAFFLAVDPATGPKSDIAAALLAVLMGALAYFLRYHGGEPYGAALAIAIVNVLVPFVRTFERRLLYLHGKTI